MNTVFLQVLNLSLIASYVILFVLVARLLLKSAPKIFSYALWGIVLFRLVFPFSFESMFSVLPANTTPIPKDIVYTAIPQISTGIEIIDNIANPILATQTATQNMAVNPMQMWISVGSWIWVAGIVLLLLYSIVSLSRLRYKLVGAVKWRDNIYLADHIQSPFVMGLLRPKIYLPSTLSEQEHEYIILHEQTHIKRLDHIIKIVGFLVLTVHWFNPLVWLAFFLCVKDMEMSCDESVMKRMDTDIRREYSASLLSLATGRKIVAGIPLAFGEGDTKSRIKNVMHYKKPTFWLVAAAVVACIAVAALLSTNPAKILEFPETSSVLSIDLEQFNEHESLGVVTITDSNDIETILSALSGARKTLRQSVNDYPANNNYLIIKLNLTGERRTLCLYSERNSYYVEEPYMGIYRSTRDSSIEIYKIYNGSGGVIGENSEDDWQPQPEYINEDGSISDEYWQALATAMASDKTEEIAVDDMGDNEKTALAWMEAWFEMYKSLPKDNMARITEGTVDRLDITRISKAGLPKAFVFSVLCSVRPTYPIARNGFWMPGNTSESPGRDETWAQLYTEVELRLGNDGKYHFAGRGSGGGVNPDIFDTVSADIPDEMLNIALAEAQRHEVR